jgi:hypothetical protein
MRSAMLLTGISAAKLTSEKVQTNSEGQAPEVPKMKHHTGKDAQSLLDPLRAFCQLLGYDDDAVRRRECSGKETHGALFKKVDELHHLLDLWDEPTFSVCVPEALKILQDLFDVMDRGVFREEVGAWNIVWFSLRNALIQKNPSAAPAWWKKRVANS